MKCYIKGVNFEFAKIYIQVFSKAKTGFNPVMICLDYKFKLLIFVFYHFLFYYVIPFNYIQLLDLSESNITSNMARQVILGEAVSRT